MINRLTEVTQEVSRDLNSKLILEPRCSLPRLQIRRFINELKIKAKGVCYSQSTLGDCSRQLTECQNTSSNQKSTTNHSPPASVLSSRVP